MRNLSIGLIVGFILALLVLFAYELPAADNFQQQFERQQQQMERFNQETERQRQEQFRNEQRNRPC